MAQARFQNAGAEIVLSLSSVGTSIHDHKPTLEENDGDGIGPFGTVRPMVEAAASRILIWFSLFFGSLRE
jgi:hypothetical protein